MTKVLSVRLHIGTQIGNAVVTSINGDKHKVTMELHAGGVYVRMWEPFPDKFIPFSNITECDISPELPLRGVKEAA